MGKGLLLLVTLFLLAACAHPFEDTYAAAHQAEVCPDAQTVQLYSAATGNNWQPTPCEAVLVKAAIDFCTQQASKTDSVDGVIDRLQTGGASLVTVSAAIAGVVGLAVSSPPTAIAGAATLIASVSTDLGKVISGTPPTATASQMITAGSSYASLNQSLAPHAYVSGVTDPYYAGLWNAVGAACPPSMLAGGFKMAKFDITKSSYLFWKTTTIQYKVQASDSTIAILESSLAAAMNLNAVVKQGATVAVSGGQVVINLAANAQAVIVSPTISAAPAKAGALEKLVVQEPVANPPVLLLTSSVAGAPPQTDDVISVQFSWLAKPGP